MDIPVLSVAYSPDGTKLAAGLGYPNHSMLIFDTQNNEQLCQLKGHRYVLSVSASSRFFYLQAFFLNVLGFFEICLKTRRFNEIK